MRLDSTSNQVRRSEYKSTGATGHSTRNRTGCGPASESSWTRFYMNPTRLPVLNASELGCIESLVSILAKSTVSEAIRQCSDTRRLRSSNDVLDAVGIGDTP